MVATAAGSPRAPPDERVRTGNGFDLVALDAIAGDLVGSRAAAGTDAANAVVLLHGILGVKRPCGAVPVVLAWVEAARSGGDGVSALGSVAGGRDAMHAGERPGELGRLAVSDLAGDVPDGDRGLGEQLGGAVHADPGQRLPERCVAVLVEAALKLTT